MLTKKQFQLVQVARGLPFDELVQRIGIPASSLMSLFGANEKDAKDPNKLISQSTFERLMALLGVNLSMDGLHSSAVILWQCPAKAAQRKAWMAAVAELRKGLFSDDIELALLSEKRGMFRRTEKMVFLRDVARNVRIVLTGLSGRDLDAVAETFNDDYRRTELISPADFSFTKTLIGNNVYRATQFDAILGGKAFKYTWTDVQAAAKEFNFNPDNLIDLMVGKMQASQVEDVGLGAPEGVIPIRRFATV